MGIDNNISGLLRGVSEGDMKSFQEFHARYYNRLFKFAIHIVKSEKSSEEIVSDVFLNIWQKRESLPNINNIEAYLYKSVKNKAISYIRDHSGEVYESIENVQLAEVSIVTDSPEEMLLTKELQLHLQKQIELLPDRCRLIFKLVKEDGMKYKKISEVLGISVRTIDAQMTIAIKRLGESLNQYI